MTDQEGRAVVVTGGTRGIGAAIARRFLAAGADVLVCGRTVPDELPSCTAGSAAFVPADIREPEQAAAVVDAAVERFGRLDLLVNNAGGAPSADSASVSPRFVERVVALNLLAPFYLAQRANAVMQQQDDGGLILNIGSIAARDPAPGTAAYAAAKGGLTTLTRALAMDFAPKVRVNQVTVGLVRTELAHVYYGDEAGQERVAAAIPMRRMAEPDDVAAACLLLASPLAGYATGAELLVDGGGEIPTRHLASAPQTAR
ncbi:SDR family oxidoreductase [Pseudonocardia sp. DSM 110487]|uniref:SDR family oxidoreductase n=1 Tax=Pseudonocardia sp. DSM 110487 TaxID=2865833 RepID=UPI001C6A58BB|nr:SDR family oxidoreductase [Pseudonocardia sp. DSM 110487]QYN39224.1 SDR family oxidoreductase [Pseudonocardia sp. DSM 110487]